MKYSMRFLTARTNDELELPVLTGLTNRELCKKIGVHEHTVAHCVMDNCECRGLRIDVVNLEDDYKPNTFEDYIEFCKFEKISPCRYTSLCQYRQSLEREKEIEQSFSI